MADTSVAVDSVNGNLKFKGGINIKIYVVLGMEMYGEDRSTDVGVFKTFETRYEAIDYAKETFQKTKDTNASLLDKYSKSIIGYPAIEEFDDDGSYCLSVGSGNDYYFFNVWVEESQLATDNWFGQVRWCEEDLKNALECCDYPVTDNNIAKLYDICDKHWFTDNMIEAGWEYMYNNIGYDDGWDIYEDK